MMRKIAHISQSISDSSFKNMILKNGYLTVAVLPQLTLQEHFSNLATLISSLNSIWTFLSAIGAVIVPFVLRKVSKGQNKRSKTLDDF